MKIVGMNFHLLLSFAVSTVIAYVSVEANVEVRPELNELWDSYKAGFKKHFSPEEESVRRAIWQENVDLISQHNVEADLGLHSYRLKLNHLCHMTSDEVKSILNANQMNSLLQQEDDTFVPSSDASLPESVNWVKEGLVTEAKNQAHCGSDWAFSATGALEGQLAKKTGQLLGLSEQNLLDCSWNQGNQGCLGGEVRAAYKYIIENAGINDELSYMYAGQNSECFFDPHHVAATMNAYKVIPKGDEQALQVAVATIGPISASIDGSASTFHFYGGGIYHDNNCSDAKTDRAVLVVGYGSENGKDYWLVKNSWGPDWGEGGYIKIARNENNHCGIANSAIFPVME